MISWSVIVARMKALVDVADCLLMVVTDAACRAKLGEGSIGDIDGGGIGGHVG